MAYIGSTATLVADSNLDSTSASGSITIPGGGNSVSFIVKALEYNFYEEDEFLKIAATPPSGYTMGTNNVSLKLTPSDIIVATLNYAQESYISATTGKFQIRFKKTGVTTKKQVKILYQLIGYANDGTVYDLINPTEAIIPLNDNHIDIEVKPIDNFIVEGVREITIKLLSVISL
ncbi:MAG: hypothetical protein LBG19_03120 [Prevotellaceae bacterium]|nr:hypothetical protein [Prevotellaceae bacterium]